MILLLIWRGIMLMTNDERKQYIDDLKKITDEREIINFLQKGLYHEYPTVFDKEREERIKIANNKLGHPYKELDNSDVRLYTLRVLKREIANKLDIRIDYMYLEEMKVILFFEHLLIAFDNSKENNAEKNKKINEGKDVYTFFRGLITNEHCNLGKFQKAVNILGFGILTQDDFDNDMYRSMHDFIEKLILDNYLLPFMDKYKNLL